MRNKPSLPRLAFAAPLLAALLASNVAAATDKVTALDIEVVRPTVVSGGIDWQIYGDDNRNAAVKLEYREAGSGSGRPAWISFACRAKT